MVDVTRPEWNGAYKMVAACLYPVEDGLIVQTATERCVETRRVVADLLLARCPDTPLVREIAAEYGIVSSSYAPDGAKDHCVLCGLCTRICDRLGVFAISSVNRGVGREVAPPFNEAPLACIGCLACATGLPDPVHRLRDKHLGAHDLGQEIQDVALQVMREGAHYRGPGRFTTGAMASRAGISTSAMSARGGKWPRRLLQCDGVHGAAWSRWKGARWTEFIV